MKSKTHGTAKGLCRVLCIIGLVHALSVASPAQTLPALPGFDPAVVRMAAPGDGKTFEWPVITLDRTGLYSKIYDAVFGAAGLKVEQLSVPQKRCYLMIKNGEADFYPGTIQGTAFEGYTFFTPRYAIWFTKGVTLLFNKKTIPEWTGVESLKGKSLISQSSNSYLQSLGKYSDVIGSELKKAIEVKDHETALRMLMAGRADVMVSSSEMILATISAMKVELDEKIFTIQYLDRAKYYPLFRQDERGKQLAAIFDKGMKELYRSGQLVAWFKTNQFASVENMDPDLQKP